MSLLLPFLTTVLAGIGAVVVRMFGPFAFIARSWFLLESNDPLLVLLLVFFMLSDRGHHVRAARIRRNVLIRSSEIPIATRSGISGHTAAEDCVFFSCGLLRQSWHLRSNVRLDCPVYCKDTENTCYIPSYDAKGDWISTQALCSHLTEPVIRVPNFEP